MLTMACKYMVLIISTVQVERIAYVHSLKEMAIPIPNQVCPHDMHAARACPARNTPSLDAGDLQSAITKDNVSLTIDGVLFVQV